MIINSLVKIEYDNNILLSRQDVRFTTYIKCVECDHRNINILQRHWSSGQEVIYKEKMHSMKLLSLFYSEHTFFLGVLSQMSIFSVVIHFS